MCLFASFCQLLSSPVVPHCSLLFPFPVAVLVAAALDGQWNFNCLPGLIDWLNDWLTEWPNKISRMSVCATVGALLLLHCGLESVECVCALHLFQTIMCRVAHTPTHPHTHQHTPPGAYASASSSSCFYWILAIAILAHTTAHENEAFLNVVWVLRCKWRTLSSHIYTHIEWKDAGKEQRQEAGGRQDSGCGSAKKMSAKP